MQKNVIWITLIIILLTCCQKKVAFTLSQQENEVDKIEIIWIYDWFSYNPENVDTFQIQQTIDPGEYSAFLKELYSVPCYRYRNDPFHGFSNNTIRVTYLDGGYELIGAHTVFYETAAGDWTFPPYYFDSNAFDKYINSWTGAV